MPVECKYILGIYFLRGRGRYTLIRRRGKRCREICHLSFIRSFIFFFTFFFVYFHQISSTFFRSNSLKTSKYLSIFFQLIPIIFFTVSSLRCNFCQSNNSFKDCESNSELVSCDYETRCGKVSYELPGNTMVYRKSCIDLAYCKDHDRYCRKASNSAEECKVLCCKEDSCNAGSRLVSGIFIWAGVAMTLVVQWIL
jgi:hypothetical protein